METVRVQRVRTAPKWMRDCVTPPANQWEEEPPTPKKLPPLKFDFEMEVEKKKVYPRNGWTEEEDAMLVNAITKVSENDLKNRWGGIWSKVSDECNMNRSGKQCRERWMNHLDPAIDWSPWKKDEDDHIVREYVLHGSRWAYIAAGLPGRRDNMVKNRFQSCLFQQVGMVESPRPPKPPKAERGLSKYYQKKRKAQEVEEAAEALVLSDSLDEILKEFAAPAEVPGFIRFGEVDLKTCLNAEPVARTGLFNVTMKPSGEAVQRPAKRPSTFHVKTRGYLDAKSCKNVFMELNKRVNK